MTDYESPAKQKLRDGLAKMGPFASPMLRHIVEEALTKIDDTDPNVVAAKLPPPVLEFYLQCAKRGHELALHGKKAADQGFHIEAIIVCHGLIQYALRGLYVLGWQRASDLPLTQEQLRPFWDHNDHSASVHRLIPVLQESGLLMEPQGELLKTVNATRNKAAHGVVFGEISHEKIGDLSRKVQWAAVGALERMLGWFQNPQPLRRFLEHRTPRARS